MAKRERSIFLNVSQTKVFISLWERQPVLWNLLHPLHKDDNAKLSARFIIAEQLAKVLQVQWDEAQVDRKISSLRGQFNGQRLQQKKARATGSEFTTTWAHFARVDAFLGKFVCETKRVYMQTIPGYYNFDQTEPSSQKTRDDWSQPPDMAVLHNQIKVSQSPEYEGYVQDNQCQASQPQSPASESGTSSTSPHPEAVSCLPSVSNVPQVVNTSSKTNQETPQPEGPNPKKRRCASSESFDPLEQAILNLTQQLAERKPEGEYHCYALYVAEQLSCIKNKKTAIKVQKAINDLIHDALLSEMSG